MYEVEFRKIFEKWFKTKNFFMEDVKKFLLDSRDDYPCYYQDFTKEYYKDYYCSVFDASITYYDQGRPVFYLPMFIYKSSGENFILSTNGEFVYHPLFNKNLSKSYVKKISSRIIGFIFDFSKSFNINNVLFYGGNEIFGGWEESVVDVSISDNIRYKYYVDLKENILEIRSSLRESYKSLVNKSLNLFKFEVFDYCTDELIEEFREFHFQVSGKRTRSRQSWKIQQDQVNSSGGFIIKISDKSDAFIGFSLFLYSKFEGMYAVGAYDRSLFEQPISHGAQWLAIEKLKSLDVSNYFIGDFHPNWQKNGITEKELAIENFKRGFANRIKAHPIWIVNL